MAVLCFCLAQVVVAETRPSVLLISMDTVRADHLGVYGYRRPTDLILAPHVASFTRFASAYTTLPLTLPAHISLMTGLHPVSFGVFNNRQVLLPVTAPPLATSLAADGYDTAAVVGSIILGRESGFGRGFQTFVEPGDHDELVLPADKILTAAADILQQWHDPLFLFVHFYDAHEPYQPPDRYRCWLRPTPVLGEILESRGLKGIDYTEVLNHEHNLGSHHGPDLLEMVASYDSGIRFVTDHVAALLDLWDARPGHENSLVIITADHGEGLGQHGYWSHGMNLNDESLRVPLLVRGPGFTPGAVLDADVSLADIAPTVLRHAGIHTRVEHSGRPLPGAAGAGSRPLLVAQRQRYVAARPPRRVRNWRQGDGFAVVEGRFKYVEEGDSPGMLFDRQTDPLELADASSERAGVRRRLQRSLARWLARVSPGLAWPPAEAGEERLRRLRRLGYID